jgi:hypothetical protein
LRDYIQRWTTLHHTVENVTEHQAVCAFKAGVRYRELYLKFGRTGDMSLNKMMEIATRYANGEEEDRLRSGKGKAVDNDGGGGNSNRKQKRPLWRRKEKTRENPKGSSPPRSRSQELMFWTCRVPST